MKSQARAKPRALYAAVLTGASLGLLLGGSYIAGAQARLAASRQRIASLEPAAAAGFSDAALKAEAASLPPGALAVARRHDAATAVSAAPGDSAKLAAPLAPAVTSDTRPPLLRAGLAAPPVPARIAHAAADHARSSELDCLSQAVYYEARGESTAGQAAVAQVVLNRVRHAGFPKTVCGVVYQGVRRQECQFSFACDGSADAPKEMAAWRKAQEIAGRALSGFVMTQVGDATNFHVASLGAIWGAGLVRVAQIGAHTFYRLTGRPEPASHAAPANAPPEPADKPVYTEVKTAPAPPPEIAGSSLILAAAVAPSPLASAERPTAPAAANGPGSTPANRSAADGQTVQTAAKGAG